MTKNKITIERVKNKAGATVPFKVGNGCAKINVEQPWERELIGNFLLELANQQVLNARQGWYVEKRTLRGEFQNYIRTLSEKGVRPILDTCIGSLMYRTNFLLNTPINDKRYRIKGFNLILFRREKYNKIDEDHLASKEAPEKVVTSITDKDGVPLLTDEDHVLDTSEEVNLLKYQMTKYQESNDNFIFDSVSCYICRRNFADIENFEDHVKYHSEESDFNSLECMEKLEKPLLKVSYQTCVKSHYFGFIMETDVSDLVIDKFIIVQSRHFYYACKSRLPLPMPETGKCIFFVDSNLFMLMSEQPVVICGFININGKTKEFVEQHHFMRTEPLPKPSFAVKPNRMSKVKVFKPGRLDMAVPPPAVVKALQSVKPEAELQKSNHHIQDYFSGSRQLTAENIHGALETLLQVEDIDHLYQCVALKQVKCQLKQFGRDISLKINGKSGVNDILSPGDHVVIINEGVGAVANATRNLLNDNNLILQIALMEFNDLKTWEKAFNVKTGCVRKKIEDRLHLGRVFSLSAERVLITCDRKLPENATFTVIFQPLRSVIRYQYRALQILATLNRGIVKRLLFPTEVSHTAAITDNECELELINEQIASNPEQLQAVRHIVTCKLFPAPYIIFGPPGTGKTATVCEAIYQLIQHNNAARVLLMAGTNTACNEVALRLIHYFGDQLDNNPHMLARVFSATCDRTVDNIDDKLLNHSNMYHGHFYPTVDTLHDYRIVICTLSLAGKFSTGGFAGIPGSGGVYTHVFVDEAAASTETEVLMGIINTIASDTNLILSGDNKQLGPVIKSKRAIEWGLSHTLFDRLMERDCYLVDSNGQYNRSIQMRLVRNYRSHPQIVDLFSKLFYDGSLKAMAPIDKVSLAKTWFHTTNSDFPILFHSEFGSSMNTAKTMSLYNSKEIDTVLNYVKDLMYFGIDGQKIAQTDIGIISPYKNQYMRIQEELNMRDWHQIECGSVEAFQGKEKPIIIVSFVRSFTPFLGFLESKRRLNVLLSRPMSVLIMIGNPRTLSLNEDFRHIIEKCEAKGTLVGHPYTCQDLNSSTKEHKNLKSSIGHKKLGKTLNNTNGLNTTFPTKLSKQELEAVFQDLPRVPKGNDFDHQTLESKTRTPHINNEVNELYNPNPPAERFTNVSSSTTTTNNVEITMGHVHASTRTMPTMVTTSARPTRVLPQNMAPTISSTRLYPTVNTWHNRSMVAPRPKAKNDCTIL